MSWTDRSSYKGGPKSRLRDRTSQGEFEIRRRAKEEKDIKMWEAGLEARDGGNWSVKK